MKKLNQDGIASTLVILIVVLVLAVGGIGWYVYNAQKKTNSTLDNTTKSQSEPQKSTKPTTPTTTKPVADPNTGYLVVKEWGVKFKEGALTQDPEYAIKDDHTLYLSTKTYSSKVGGSACGANGSTGQLIRGKAGYDTNGMGLAIEKVSSAVKVGDYYYFWQGPQAGCTTPTDTNTAIMNTYQAALSDLVKTVQAL